MQCQLRRPGLHARLSCSLLLTLLAWLPASTALAVDVNAQCAALYGSNFVASTGQVTAATPKIPRPAKGSIFADPNFGTCVVRATDHAVEPPTSFARSDYARRQAFNADNTRFIAYASGGGWHLYDARTLVWIRQLSGISGTAEPQWHPTDPKVLYYVPGKGGLSLLRLDVEANTSTTAASFSGKLPWSATAHVWTRGEGSPSADGRYWCFVAENSSAGILGVFTYDLQAQSVLGTRSLTTAPDHVSMTPSGRSCVLAGTVAWNRTFTASRTLLSGSQHNDLAMGVNGEDYYVFIDQSGNGYLSMIDIDTGVRTNLMPTWVEGTTTSGHVSGKAFGRPGWVLYSTFNHSGTTEKWLHERVMAVELKAAPKIINVAQHHQYYNGYWTQPHATVSRDFTRVLFNSNWGTTSDMDVDAYMARLPDNLFGPAPDTVAPTVTASVNGSSGMITLAANATDNVGVKSVDFMVDGVLKGNDSTSPFSYPVDSATLGNGNHSLVSIAYDAATNAGQSSPAPFSVSNVVASSDRVVPVVSASVQVGSASVTLKATASDNVGVSKVEFYVDGVLRGTDTTRNYVMTLDTRGWGSGTRHSMVAKAYDAAGNVGSSNSVGFTVR